MSNSGQGLRFSKTLRNDFPASVVVFFVAVPLCLGIAMASGAPLFAGIIAGIVGGIIVGAISNSAVGVSGPAAGLTVIVLSGIERLGGFEVFLVAVALAGLIQIALGLLKAGVIGYYFPSSVIKGMLSAIGIIIIMKQLPHAVGYDKDYEGDMSFAQIDGENTFSELIHMLGSIEAGAIIIFSVAMIILLFWDSYVKKIHPAFNLVQGPLVAVVAGIVYQLVTTSYFPEVALGGKHLVSVPVASNFGEFFGQFTVPDISHAFRSDVMITAFTVAIVASLESLLSVEATDKLDSEKRITDTNRELIAQGSGNLVSGLIGGLPVTQVILRSTANIQSGAKSKFSAILHGMLLLTCVAFIPGILNLVPLSVLAAILLVIGYKLVNPSTIRAIYQSGWSQFIPFMATILGIVLTDLLIGIGIGLVVAVFLILRNSYKNSHFLHREELNGSKLVKMTLAEEVFFLNKGTILRALNDIPEGSRLIVDMSNSVHVDPDVLEIIEDFKKTSQGRNVSMEVIERNKKTKKKRVKSVELEHETEPV